MKTGSAVAVLAFAVSMSFALVGCESSSSAPPDQNPGYAGGDGAFGEDPAQPGEHSGVRFHQSSGGGGSYTSIPGTQPSR